MSATEPLPFHSHAELVDGLKSKRFEIAVRFDPRSVRWFDQTGERVIFTLMAYSPAFVALGFVVLAFWTRRPWLLLAVPMSFLDDRLSSGRLTLPHLLYWLLWWLLAAPVWLVSRPAAHAMFAVAPCFMLTQFLSAAGKGVTHLRVLDAIGHDPTAFDWFLSRGIIALLDHQTRTWYGDPAARDPSAHIPA